MTTWDDLILYKAPPLSTVPPLPASFCGDALSIFSILLFRAIPFSSGSWVTARRVALAEAFCFRLGAEVRESCVFCRL